MVSVQTMNLMAQMLVSLGNSDLIRPLNRGVVAGKVLWLKVGYGVIGRRFDVGLFRLNAE
jgi:hypothetical protein